MRPAPRTPRRLFHGWLIVLTAFLCHAVNVGLVFYAWGVFLTPLSKAFGGRGPVALGYSAMQVGSAVYGLLVGVLVDRHGARPVQIVGAMMLATGFFAMSTVHSLPALYACFMIPLAIGACSVGNIPANTAVARWFVRRRGTALGLSTAGISFGGIVFAPLTQWLIDHVGWRGAYQALAALVVIVVIPPVLAFQVRDPADIGLEPDGDAPGDEAVAAERAVLARELERSVTPRLAVRQRSFWLLAACFGLTMAGIAGMLLFQIPLLIDRGMPATHASLLLGATAAMGMLGKLGFGAILDRFDQRRVASACFLAQAAGIAVIWLGHGPLALLTYVLLYGYAMGGNATLQASLIGEVFGRLHYGAISSRVTPFIVLSQAVTVPAVGWIRDHVGSYDPALAGIAAAAIVAAVLVGFVDTPSHQRVVSKYRS
jgi:MFS family permease